jgi:hypothetical protein
MAQVERRKKPVLLSVLTTVDVTLLVLAALAFMVPVQDYALHEYRIWWSNRSTQNWKAFQDKKKEEADIRTEVGSLLALTGAGLGLFIVRKRFKSA